MEAPLPSGRPFDDARTSAYGRKGVAPASAGDPADLGQPARIAPPVVADRRHPRSLRRPGHRLRLRGSDHRVASRPRGPERLPPRTRQGAPAWGVSGLARRSRQGVPARLGARTLRLPHRPLRFPRERRHERLRRLRARGHLARQRERRAAGRAARLRGPLLATGATRGSGVDRAWVRASPGDAPAVTVSGPVPASLPSSTRSRRSAATSGRRSTGPRSTSRSRTASTTSAFSSKRAGSWATA